MTLWTASLLLRERKETNAPEFTLAHRISQQPHFCMYSPRLLSFCSCSLRAPPHLYLPLFCPLSSKHDIVIRSISTSHSHNILSSTGFMPHKWYSLPFLPNFWVPLMTTSRRVYQTLFYHALIYQPQKPFHISYADTRSGVKCWRKQIPGIIQSTPTIELQALSHS